MSTIGGMAMARNILFTRELARRLDGAGVTANCLHPGFVATRIAGESGGLISRFAGLAKPDHRGYDEPQALWHARQL